MAGNFTALLTNVDTALNNFAFKTYASLSTEFTTTVKIVFILYWVIYGLMIIQGWIEFHINEFVKNGFRLTLIYIFLTNWSVFNTFVYDIFTNGPNQIGSAMLSPTGSSSANINSGLDNILDTGLFASFKMMESGITNLDVVLFGLLFMVVVIFLVCYAAYLIIMSKIAIALLLGLAPIFIIMMVFKKTYGLFEGWFRQLLNFFFISVIAYGFLVLVISLITPSINSMNAITSGYTTTNIIPTLFIAIIAIGLMFQTMGIAAGIAGGIQLGGVASSFLNNAKRAGDRVSKATKGALNKKPKSNTIKN